LAKELLSPDTELIGTEPESGNDAFLSIKQGEIFRFDKSPETYADGLKTLGVSGRTFEHLKKLDDMTLVNESRILYWTAWLIHLLKVACEPSCAMNMEAVLQYRRKSSKKRPKILVLISGGNIDPILYRELWQKDYLLDTPAL
jgi:threonine dehydratase